jgi:hypothetical protein
MNRSSPLADRVRRIARALPVLAVLVVMPKCALCIAAYLGLGAVLGLREVCKVSPMVAFGWTPAWTGSASAVLGLAAAIRWTMRRRVRRFAPRACHRVEAER